MDMGFHRGVELQVVRNAPLVDPVEFLIERTAREPHGTRRPFRRGGSTVSGDLRMALWPPNCGQSTVFYMLTVPGSTANYPRVTVDVKKGKFRVGERTVEVGIFPYLQPNHPTRGGEWSPGTTSSTGTGTLC
jgi:hypothetical protein